MAAALLAIVGLTERENTPRSFIPVLATVAGITVILSAFYLAALRTRLAHRTQGYIQFSLDICIVTWLVYRTGDVESPFLALYLVIIFAACALLGRTGVSLVGALAGLLYVCVGVLTISKLLPRAGGWSPYEGTELSWTQFMFSLNLVAIFAVGDLIQPARRAYPTKRNSACKRNTGPRRLSVIQRSDHRKHAERPGYDRPARSHHHL